MTYANNRNIGARALLPNEMDQSYCDMLYQQQDYNPTPTPYTSPSSQLVQYYPMNDQYFHQYPVSSQFGHPLSYAPSYTRMTPSLVEEPNVSYLVS